MPLKRGKGSRKTFLQSFRELFKISTRKECLMKLYVLDLGKIIMVGDNP